jgi:hypothetical protein
MARAILISADCHAAVKSDGQGSNPHDSEMRRYVSPGYREAYDAWLAARQQMAAEVAARMGNELFADIDEDDNVIRRDLSIKPRDEDIAGTAGWDPQRRIRELESDGVVADIIYPNGVPFQAAFNTRGVSAELEREGARAYNRWLAEFVSHNPERHAGCAVLQVSDVGEVTDVDWACRHGLRAAFLDPMANGYEGPVRSTQIWTRQIKDFVNSGFMTIGDNFFAPNSKPWTILNFNVGGNNLANYVSPKGEIILRVKSNNTTSNAFIDYEAITITTTSMPIAQGPAIYVSTTGSDSNPGTIGRPFRTIAHRPRKQARAAQCTCAERRLRVCHPAASITST